MSRADLTPSWAVETCLVHGGQRQRTATSAGTPTVLPIHASTTYLHHNAEALDEAFTGARASGEPAYVYARQGNPNASVLADALAQIEGGVGALTFASGTAAVHAALLAAGLAPGSKIIASQDLYGPTINLLCEVFVPLGVELLLADMCVSDVASIIRAEQPDVIYVESISNPLVKLVDLEAIGLAAGDVGAVTIVDSTVTTPYLLRPLEQGIDLIVHSATKYIAGHGDSTGGVVISARRALFDQLRTYALHMGAMLSPFEAHLILRGLRTLAVRMERHCSNALHVARFLQQHPAISRVYYPGLADHPQHALAARLLKHGHYGGLLAFEVRQQTREAAFRVMDGLQLCLPVTSLGDVFSQVSYPPVSSHRNLTAAQRQSMGITEGCIRLSVGIENVEDIIGDLDQALRGVGEGVDAV
jgi:cystathionine beta-lyase/cystathionine gamma-synthase